VFVNVKRRVVNVCKAIIKPCYTPKPLILKGTPYQTVNLGGGYLIQIIIPDFEFKSDSASVNVVRRRGGLYLFYGKGKYADHILYVGKAADLRGRIRGHYKGTTNTRRIKHNFGIVTGFYEDNPVSRDIYETFLVDKYKPPLNREKTYTYRHRFYDDCWLTTRQLVAKTQLQGELDDIYLSIDL
jgi:hypothetical protein